MPAVDDDVIPRIEEHLRGSGFFDFIEDFEPFASYLLHQRFRDDTLEHFFGQTVSSHQHLKSPDKRFRIDKVSRGKHAGSKFRMTSWAGQKKARLSRKPSFVRMNLRAPTEGPYCSPYAPIQNLEHVHSAASETSAPAASANEPLISDAPVENLDHVHSAISETSAPAASANETLASDAPYRPTVPEEPAPLDLPDTNIHADFQGNTATYSGMNISEMDSCFQFGELYDDPGSLALLYRDYSDNWVNFESSISMSMAEESSIFGITQEHVDVVADERTHSFYDSMYLNDQQDRG